MKLRRKLLALSLPKSGSRYLTLLLKHGGCKVGHEMFKRDGAVTSFFGVEDVWYPGKHWTDDGGVEDESRQRRSHYVFDQVWHFTRDPRKVIASMASIQLPRVYWCWAERHTGVSCGLYPMELRSMLTWVKWNELIEKNEKIDFFFRIEDIDEVWPTIKERIGADQNLEIPDALPRNYGTFETGPRKTVPLSYEEMNEIDPLAASRVREMAERYGYKD